MQTEDSTTGDAGLRRCGDCGEFKPLDAFHRHAHQRDGRSWRCKDCYRHYQRTHRRGALLSVGEYERRLVEQGGVCAACKSPTPGGGRRYFDVDHDHATGRVRGLLCMACNRMAGWLEGENYKRVVALLAYLSGHA